MFQLQVITNKRSVQNADCRLQTADRVQNADRYKMQTADCRLGTKCRLTFEAVFFILLPVVTQSLFRCHIPRKLALPGNDLAPLLETKTLSHDFILCSNCVVIHDPMR